MGAAVESRSLVKRYQKGTANAVDEVSFSVETGEVFGLLGPNGAGKTTTVGMLTTRVRPTGGSASIGGFDVVRDAVSARGQLAVVPQRSNLDRSLSIRNNLLFHAAYHGVPAALARQRADELLEQFGLAARGNGKPDLFSGGQAQRVMIARALMHQPQVMFLDEPTTGLDPAARLFVWDLLRELTVRGVTLVLTTHDMHEAATLADRVGVMDHGKLLALDSPEALLRTFPGGTTLDLTTTAVPDATRTVILAALAALEGVERVEQRDAGPDAAGDSQFGARLHLLGDAPAPVAPAAALLASHHVTLRDLKLGTPTLEDVFIHLTGRALR